MRFSCAPPERGGHTNKGSEHDHSIDYEPAAQHGQRPVAKWRQRQLQTLVRRPNVYSASSGSARNARIVFGQSSLLCAYGAL